MNILTMKRWGWLTGGVGFVIIFFLAVAIVKPIGVSTQFVIFDGIVWDSVADVVVESEGNASGYGSPNAYLNKSGGKYAASVAHPLNYGLVFVLAMIFGGFLGKYSARRGQAVTGVAPTATTQGEYARAFFGGVLVLFGARLAGGCTSGHMMSGMMQTSLSGYAFTLAVFITAVPVAILLYRRRG